MEDTECNVCYEEDLELVSPRGFGELKCTHYLCENCWKEIAKTKTECPMCREDVREWMIEMKYVSSETETPTPSGTGIRMTIYSTGTGATTYSVGTGMLYCPIAMYNTVSTPNTTVMANVTYSNIAYPLTTGTFPITTNTYPPVSINPYATTYFNSTFGW